MKNVNPARELAAKSLRRLSDGKYVNLEVSAALKPGALSSEDRGLYTALVYGVVERLITLDYIIEKQAVRPVCEISEDALWALRLGIYQLAFMDKIPPHAAVDQSVELCEKRSSRGFVNAVLRSFIRGGCKICYPDRISGGEAGYLSVRYSVPIPLCRMFIEWYGAEFSEKLFSAFLQKENIGVRVNTLKISVNDAAERIGAVISGVCGFNLSVSSVSDERVASGLDEGLWFVQDAASSLCAQVLAPQPGERIADVCAAPGGKSFAAAISMKNRGEVYSFDLHENKISLIREGAKRLGIDIISARDRDARNPDSALLAQCDRVLCDAPCSGFGVIGKKPDIKYKDPESAARLPSIQLDILRSSSGYVKEGGILVYSTCTLNPEENGGVVGRFLAENEDFEKCPFEWSGGRCEGELTLFPHLHKTDGFYICKLKRRDKVRG